MRTRLALLIGTAFIVAGVVALLPSDDGEVTAGSTSTSTTEADSTTTSAEAQDATTTSESGGSTATTTAGETTTTSEAGDTTTTTEAGDTTTTTAQGTTTTTQSGPDEEGPTIANIVISDDDLTEWCDGDAEAAATMTISLTAEDPSGIEDVFVSWLVDLSDGFGEFVLDGGTWETRILFESGTIFDILEPQQIDMTIVAEDTAGNFTFVDRFGPTLTPQECG